MKCSQKKNVYLEYEETIANGRRACGKNSKQTSNDSLKGRESLFLRFGNSPCARVDVQFNEAWATRYFSWQPTGRGAADVSKYNPSYILKFILEGIFTRRVCYA